jgi:hypothetical protein
MGHALVIACACFIAATATPPFKQAWISECLKAHTQERCVEAWEKLAAAPACRPGEPADQTVDCD